MYVYMLHNVTRISDAGLTFHIYIYLLIMNVSLMSCILLCITIKYCKRHNFLLWTRWNAMLYSKVHKISGTQSYRITFEWHSKISSGNLNVTQLINQDRILRHKWPRVLYVVSNKLEFIYLFTHVHINLVFEDVFRTSKHQIFNNNIDIYQVHQVVMKYSIPNFLIASLIELYS